MAGIQYFGNVVSQPAWMGDFAGRDHLMPFGAKIDPTQFADQSGILVTVGVAGAAQGATSIPVAALAYPFQPALTIIATGNVLIPSGTVISFGGAKFARLTADAIIGDTALTVAALPTALVSGDVGTYSAFQGDVILSGTIVGRTYAQRDAGSPFIPAIYNTHDEIYVVAFDVPNARHNNDIVLYRPPSVIKENYLPGYSTVLAPGGTAGNLLTKLRTIYQCIKGVN